MSEQICLWIFSSILQALIHKTGLNPSEVSDIVVGTILAPGSQRASECRMDSFYAGFPGVYPTTSCVK